MSDSPIVDSEATGLAGISGFEHLSDGASAGFRATRLVVHWLAQLPSAAGSSLAPAAEDFSHTSLEWLEEAGVLAGVRLPDGRRAVLDIRRLRLTVVDADGAAGPELSLRGATLDGARVWLDEQLSATLTMPAHELPAHPVGEGAPVPDLTSEDLEALARWFGNAARVLRRVTELHEHAAEVRCWPHHFDLATLVRLDAEGGGEEARSIGVGMTPGDGGVPVPYYYVTPWPYPPTDRLPGLGGGGHWNTDGWVGALLRGDALEGDADQQRDQVAAFVSSALTASLELLTR